MCRHKVAYSSLIDEVGSLASRFVARIETVRPMHLNRFPGPPPALPSTGLQSVKSMPRPISREEEQPADPNPRTDPVALAQSRPPAPDNPDADASQPKRAAAFDTRGLHGGDQSEGSSKADASPQIALSQTEPQVLPGLSHNVHSQSPGGFPSMAPSGSSDSISLPETTSVNAISNQQRPAPMAKVPLLNLTVVQAAAAAVNSAMTPQAAWCDLQQGTTDPSNSKQALQQAVYQMEHPKIEGQLSSVGFMLEDWDDAANPEETPRPLRHALQVMCAP